MRPFLLQHRKIIVLVTLFLIIITIFSYLIYQGFWAIINTQGMIRLAKEQWNKGDYAHSIYWYHAAYSNALVSGLRWEIFRIYDHRTGELLKQGKLSEALEACKQAAKIWNQEGATSYQCLSIEQEFIKKRSNNFFING